VREKCLVAEKEKDARSRLTREKRCVVNSDTSRREIGVDETACPLLTGRGPVGVSVKFIPLEKASSGGVCGMLARCS
jgi:hypothetical protein